MLTMDDIIREGHPTLRVRSQKIDLPISSEVKEIGQAMMEFVQNSQDDELAKKYDLRPGVGLAAPQIDQAIRMTVVHVPSEDPQDPTPEFSDVLINPQIVRQSLKKIALPTGEGCLSVDRQVPGYVPRAKRIHLEYTDLNGQEKKIKLKGYPAIVVQHEIDHLNGVMFYDHINPDDPFALDDQTSLLGE